MKLPVKNGLPLLALALLSACGGSGGELEEGIPAAPRRAAPDTPVVLGPAYTVDGVAYRPADVANLDSVGYAAVGYEGGAGISASHRTMPLPSYAEVTSLDTGRTILVRVDRRGPMTGALITDLSPGAAEQLGIAGQQRFAIRMRRVNPPDSERGMLRNGLPAPARMDTPQSLLAILKKKLGTTNEVILGSGKQAVPPPDGAMPMPAPTTNPPAVPARPTPRPIPAKPEAAPPVTSVPPRQAPVPTAVRTAPRGSLIVQVGAFSSRDRAEQVAGEVGGFLSGGRGIWRVRTGPYPSQAAAQAALAKVRAAGYSDARIQHAD